MAHEVEQVSISDFRAVLKEVKIFFRRSRPILELARVIPRTINVFVVMKNINSSIGKLPIKIIRDFSGLIVQVPELIASESANAR